MDVAPPPELGSRVQEVGDVVLVRFRPRRSWSEIGFLLVWLAFWTIGGLAAIGAIAEADPGGRAFLLFWLCGWLVGEGCVVTIVAWQLRGREALSVTAEHVEVRREIGRFVRTRLYSTAAVRNVEAAPVPADEDERPRKDFCVRLSLDEKAIRVGEGMSEREAEYVASVVLAKIRPRAGWGDDTFGWGRLESAR